MEAAEIYEEARRVMDRANEVNATPEDVLMMLSVILANLLARHAPDPITVGQVIAHHNMHTINCYGRLKRDTPRDTLH